MPAREGWKLRGGWSGKVIPEQSPQESVAGDDQNTKNQPFVPTAKTGGRCFDKRDDVGGRFRGGDWNLGDGNWREARSLLRLPGVLVCTTPGEG